ATDEWVQQARPEAYFRLADPDFTLQPVYVSLKGYLTASEPALYPGMHEAAGWGIEATGDWQTVAASDAPFGRIWAAGSGAELAISFHGTGLALSLGCPQASCVGSFTAQVDD